MILESGLTCKYLTYVEAGRNKPIRERGFKLIQSAFSPKLGINEKKQERNKTLNEVLFP